MPKAVLLLAHGLTEHSGRYMNLVNAALPRGYAVYALDHYGHGRSEGRRAYVRRFDDFVATLRQYVKMVRGWQPTLPMFLVGHSMGGLISAVYLTRYQDGLRGAVLSAPALQPASPISPALRMTATLLSRLFPIYGLLPINGEGLSRDPAIKQAFLNDPLVPAGGKVTVHLAAEIVEAMARVAPEISNITLPLLVLQGTADRLMHPDGARLLYQTARSADKTLKIYEGCYHELFNEPERDMILQDVLAWLDAR